MLLDSAPLFRAPRHATFERCSARPPMQRRPSLALAASALQKMAASPTPDARTHAQRASRLFDFFDITYALLCFFFFFFFAIACARCAMPRPTFDYWSPVLPFFPFHISLRGTRGQVRCSHRRENV